MSAFSCKPEFRRGVNFTQRQQRVFTLLMSLRLIVNVGVYGYVEEMLICTLG